MFVSGGTLQKKGVSVIIKEVMSQSVDEFALLFEQMHFLVESIAYNEVYSCSIYL